MECTQQGGTLLLHLDRRNRPQTTSMDWRCRGSRRAEGVRFSTPRPSDSRKDHGAVSSSQNCGEQRGELPFQMKPSVESTDFP